jgi:hypothetical protein
MTYVFRSVPPPLTQTEFNTERQSIANAINGITLDGVRAYPYTYLVRKNGSVYEAIDHTANVAYGGSGNAGSVDGTSPVAVIQAAINADLHGIVALMPGTYVMTDSLLFDSYTRCHLIGVGGGDSVLLDFSAATLEAAIKINFAYDTLIQDISIKLGPNMTYGIEFMDGGDAQYNVFNRLFISAADVTVGQTAVIYNRATSGFHCFSTWNDIVTLKMHSTIASIGDDNNWININHWTDNFGGGGSATGYLVYVQFPSTCWSINNFHAEAYTGKGFYIDGSNIKLTNTIYECIAGKQGFFQFDVNSLGCLLDMFDNEYGGVTLPLLRTWDLGTNNVYQEQKSGTSYTNRYYTKTDSAVIPIHGFTGETWTPGAVYAEQSVAYRVKLDFSKYHFTEARLVVQNASGDNAGSSKGIEVINNTSGGLIAKYEWSGNAAQTEGGDWNPISYSTDDQLGVYAKAAVAETLTVKAVTLYLR